MVNSMLQDGLMANKSVKHGESSVIMSALIHNQSYHYHRCAWEGGGAQPFLHLISVKGGERVNWEQCLDRIAMQRVVGERSTELMSGL